MLSEELSRTRNQLRHVQLHHLRILNAVDNPSGILLCQRHGNGFRWKRRYMQDGRIVTVDLPKTEKVLAEKLAVNLYRIECIEHLQKQIDSIDQLDRNLNSAALGDQKAEMLRGNILTEYSSHEFLYRVRFCPRKPADFFNSQSPYWPFITSHLEKEYAWIISWYLSEFKQSKEHPENLQFMTKLGFKVRSKSEVMEAEKLFDAGILFHYEEQVPEAGDDCYPDFYIPIKLAERYIWEHLGAMDKENYFYRTRGKIVNYLDRHWLPGINLLMTCETRQYPLTEEQVDHQIEWLKGRYRIAFPDLPPDESFNLYDLAAVVKLRQSAG